MAEERIVYSQTVEGLFVRSLGGKLTPACKAELKKAGIDLDLPLKSTYPASLWAEALQIARRHFFPGLAPDEGMRKLGALFIEGFAETLTGKVILAVSKLSSPARSVHQLSRRLASGNNFMRAEVRSVTDTSLHIWLNDSGSGGPYFMAGIFERSLSMIGAKKLNFVIDPKADHSVEYRATWEL